MQKVWRCCAAVLSRVIFIGFGIQIVLGIVWMFRAFANLNGFGEGIVCVGQILLAGCAAYFFFYSLGIRRWQICLFGCFAIVTFPMVLQCHMTVGTRSVWSSLLLLLVGLVICLSRKKKAWYYPVLIIAVTGAVTAAGCLYRGGNSVGACAASRFAWTTLSESYESWPEEYKKKIDQVIAIKSWYEASGIKEYMLPYLRDSVGNEKAEKLLKNISAYAWKHNAPRILKEMAWDGAGYVVPPVVAPLQLKGRAYDSYTGINYRGILEPAPLWGKRYMDYGCWWFKVGLVLAGVLLLGKLKRINIWNAVIVFLPGLIMALLYTMSGAGQMDYRNAVYILSVWIAAMMMAVERTDE